jgi:hypothetical protein
VLPRVYAGDMRYAQRGGYTPAEQERRERLGLQTAERFEDGESTRDVARDLRVNERSVGRWRAVWRGPLAHGFADDHLGAYICFEAGQGLRPPKDAT